MKIYISHSVNLNYIDELYTPIKNSDLVSKHNFVFPHELGTHQHDIKDTFKDTDLIIAEVSISATGQGLELGYAASQNIPIICIYKERIKYPNSLHTVSDNFYAYTDSASLIKALEEIILSLHIN